MKEGVRPHNAEAPQVTVDQLKCEDIRIVLSLRVREDQKKFVANNKDSLAEAEENPACVPLVIRAKEGPVGFAMYALDQDDGNYWIYRLMIDDRFQRRGYGSAALIELIRMIAEIPDCSCIMLGVKPENNEAVRVYERAGFRLTGDILDGELIMSYQI